MIHEALEYLVGLGAREPHREAIGGLEYTDRELKRITPPRASALKFARLQGFVDHIKLVPDEKERVAGPTMIHVESPTKVSFVTALDSAYRDREVIAVAEYGLATFAFREFMMPENFVIAVMTSIADASDRARLLQIVGNISSDLVSTSADDGITQTVAVKTGVTLVNKKTVENPFNLQVHRTFAEVAQPEAPYILRVRQSGPGAPPTVALFEADNGAWAIDAIAKIAEWLELKVGDVPVLA